MNMLCIYHISVRRTVIELQSFIRLAIRTPVTRLQGHPRSELMVPLERAFTGCQLKLSKRMTQDAPFTRYRRFYGGTISGCPSCSLVGSSQPKSKSGFEPSGCGFLFDFNTNYGAIQHRYPTIIHNAADRRTDGRTDMLLTIAHPML